MAVIIPMFMGLHCVCTGELSCLLGWYARVLLMHVHSGQDSLFLPTATKLGQGNIFTGICLSAGGRGVCLSACWDMPHGPNTNPPRSRPPQSRHTLQGADTPQSRRPPGADPTPARKQTSAYGQRVAGTHPTGMHSCCINTHVIVP